MLADSGNNLDLSAFQITSSSCYFHKMSDVSQWFGESSASQDNKSPNAVLVLGSYLFADLFT